MTGNQTTVFNKIRTADGTALKIYSSEQCFFSLQPEGIAIQHSNRTWNSTCRSRRWISLRTATDEVTTDSASRFNVLRGVAIVREPWLLKPCGLLLRHRQRCPHQRSGIQTCESGFEMHDLCRLSAPLSESGSGRRARRCEKAA